MASLGDSITSGVFANFRREDAVHPWAQARFFKQLADYVISGRNPLIIERKPLSWSTGLDTFRRVKSHARRIVQLHKQRRKEEKDLEVDALLFKKYVKAKNFALTGSQVEDVMRDQLPELLEWSEKKLGQAAPDYVTLLIGANDLCSNRADEITSTSNYIEDLAYVVDTILTRSPNTRILVSSLPQVQNVRKTLADEKLTGGKVARTCADLWKMTKICKRLTLEDDPQKNEELALQVKEYFEATQQMVEQRREMYGDRIRFSTALSETPIQPNDVSMDCFHPGPQGQNRLADMTWQASWWSQGTAENN
jgi:lysophospholipase L1-like esterase